MGIYFDQTESHNHVFTYYRKSAPDLDGAGSGTVDIKLLATN